MSSLLMRAQPISTASQWRGQAHPHKLTFLHSPFRSNYRNDFSHAGHRATPLDLYRTLSEHKLSTSAQAIAGHSGCTGFGADRGGEGRGMARRGLWGQSKGPLLAAVRLLSHHRRASPSCQRSDERVDVICLKRPLSLARHSPLNCALFPPCFALVSRARQCDNKS